MRNVAFLILFTASAALQARNSDGLLHQADSLFNARQFRESAQAYRELFASGQQSAAAILRAAYLAEAAGRRDETLLYLYRYYHLTKDEAAYDKLSALAEQYGLQGYEQSDADYLRHQFAEIGPQIQAVLASLILLALAVLFNLRRRNIMKGRYALAFTSLVLSALLFASLNLLSPPSKAIVTNDRAIVFEGPSAAADRNGLLSQGEMVEVIGQEDIWLKIRYREKTAFVREGLVELI